MKVDELIATITDRVKDTANVHVVFGEPIVSEGVTIIPVASVKVAGGGGGGSGKAKKTAEGAEAAEPEAGMGLGMRITTTPVGYIQVKDGEAKLIPIIDTNKLALGGMVVSGLFMVMISGVVKMIAGKKQPAAAA